MGSLDVVKMTTSSAAKVEIFVKMTAFLFQSGEEMAAIKKLFPRQNSLWITIQLLWRITRLVTMIIVLWGRLQKKGFQ